MEFLCVSADGLSFIPIDNIPDKSHLFETRDIVSISEDTPGQVLLTGFDPDGDTLSFEIVSQPSHGTLTEGTPYSSEGHEHSHPSGYQFASYVYTPNSNYSTEDAYSDSFTYKVNDGTFDSEFIYGNPFGIQAYPAIETIQIQITPVNDIPVADAGSDQSVDVGSVVQLDGSQSSDADGDTVTYSWIQTSGYPVTLTADNIVKPQFTASQDGQLIFMLTVKDGISTSNPSIINISVKPNFELVYIIVAAVAVSGGIGAIFFMKKRSKAPTVVQQESPSRRQTTVLFCSNCGNSLKPEAKFCGSCGNQV